MCFQVVFQDIAFEIFGRKLLRARFICVHINPSFNWYKMIIYQYTVFCNNK